eukprot:TRINITY_DN50432_c0_g1_i1.p1 TRINITY_DN50432_c0_g1~~TRINITY_DN50432_c0_g1_i1.p1  ORF type:complete len:146 (+),score=28.38 TRINITY_DN50432_c0_g1_i1:23-460(+)
MSAAKKLDAAEIFAYCDRDRDGRLQKSEFIQALRYAGACPTAADLQEVYTSFGTTPDIAGFRRALEVLIARRPKPTAVEEQLRGLAQDGLVDADALRYITTNFGEKLNDAEVAELMRLAEPDPDGNVKVSKLAANLLPKLPAQGK